MLNNITDSKNVDDRLQSHPLYNLTMCLLVPHFTNVDDILKPTFGLR